MRVFLLEADIVSCLYVALVVPLSQFLGVPTCGILVGMSCLCATMARQNHTSNTCSNCCNISCMFSGCCPPCLHILDALLPVVFHNLVEWRLLVVGVHGPVCPCTHVFRDLRSCLPFLAPPTLVLGVTVVVGHTVVVVVPSWGLS